MKGLSNWFDRFHVECEPVPQPPEFPAHTELTPEQLQAIASWLVHAREFLKRASEVTGLVGAIPGVDDNAEHPRFVAALDQRVTKTAKWISELERTVRSPTDYVADPLDGSGARYFELQLIQLDGWIDAREHALREIPAVLQLMKKRSSNAT